MTKDYAKSMFTARNAEASQLGFKPGEWPDRIKIDGRLYLRTTYNRDADNDITDVIYRSASKEGEAVRIWND